ncbi:ATP-dependent endonuclease [Fusobacteria bacterium ZRK30]|nr:ATP-dependent endonuclease [Fusobacteria bacterium ZRK30]
MKLHSLKIENFRKIKSASVLFEDATFLIGENNVGKSTVLKSIDFLLNSERTMSGDNYYKYCDERGTLCEPTNEVVLTAEFRNLPTESKTWKGFKGRVFNYDTDDEADTGLGIIYRKKYPFKNNVIIEMKSFKRILKEEFIACKTLNDYITNGIEECILVELFPGIKLDKNLTVAQKKILLELDELYDINEHEYEWHNNPGGIMQNVLSKLPKLLLIPASDKKEEMGEKKGALVDIMSELFSEVRSESKNYEQAQVYLNALSKEMNPDDTTSKFGIMMNELNGIFTDVFPGSLIHTDVDLSNPDNALKPEFKISMSSNVKTPISFQGTGSIRSAVFSLLKFRHERELRKDESKRASIIIAFEEPELYLHPNAANSIRDTIYDLANAKSQIICTTHSPFMIDLSKKPKQILNNMTNVKNNIEVAPFNTSHAYKTLEGNEQLYIKMLLKMDDYLTRVFFAKKIIIVEGDTEEIVMRETIERMPSEVKKRVKSEVQIIRARGKAIIISLAKYLNAMNINYYVIHDRDKGVVKAESFNDHIVSAIGNPDLRIMLEECIEDVLGYQAPSSNKPYKAYTQVSQWGENWEDVNEKWRTVVETALSDYFTS